MLKDTSHIDRIFNTALSEYGENMPDYSWDIISAELQEKKKKKRLIYFWTAAATVTIFLSFVLGYYSGVSESNTESVLISQSENKFEGNRSVNETEAVQTTNNSSDFSASNSGSNDNYNSGELISTTEKKSNVHIEDDRLLSDDENLNIIIEEKKGLFFEEDTNNNIEKISPEKKILLRNELTDIKEEDILKEEINKNGNDPEILANNHSKWSVGGQVSSGLSAVNRLSENYTLGSFLIPADNISENIPDSRIFSYSAGVRTSYEIRKKMDIQSGIMLTRYENKFSNTEIPVLLNYTLLDRKFQINTMGGPSIGFLNSNAQMAMNIQAVLGLEGVYSINKRFSVNLTPLIKYPVPVNQNIITDYNFRYFGFSTGLNYKL